MFWGFRFEGRAGGYISWEAKGVSMIRETYRD